MTAPTPHLLNDKRSSTPEIDWMPQKAYTAVDNDGQHVCAMTGMPQQLGEVVFRGAHIDDFYGFFTISEASARQLAYAVGWIDPSKVDELVDSNIRLENEVFELTEKIAALQALVDAYDAVDEAEAAAEALDV